MLVNHPTVLVAVVVAALLAGLAASSAPFVTTAAASQALKNRLGELTSFATGIEFSASNELEGDALASQLPRARAVRDSAEAFRSSLGYLGAPVLTTQVSASVTGPGGPTMVELMARTGALAHVTVLRRLAGPGIWLSDITAQAAGVEVGGTVTIQGLESFRAPGALRVRVTGIYRALSHGPETDFWANYVQEIYPQCITCNAPPPFAFLSDGQLRHLLAGSHAAVTSNVELPIDPHGLTLGAARSLATRFGRLSHGLQATPLGRALGCARTFPPVSCTVTSSLSAAVILANENASAVTPAVMLLSDLGAGIALAVAAAAGVFLVRRRRAEAALLYARGAHVGSFAARCAIEVALPTLVGGLAGFGLGYALTDEFAGGSISSGTVDSALAHAAVVVAIVLCLLVASAAVAFLSLYDSGSRGLGRLRFVPWELALAAAAAYLLIRIRAGGGITTSSSGARAPTLAVFVYPILLVAAVSGVAARAARVVLRRTARRASGVRPPVYLALRRLAAARGLIVVLVVVASVSLGSLFYVETLAGSLDQTTIEKAFMATGSDASAIVPNARPVPPSFPYPVSFLEFANQSASLDDGTSIDVMVVDPSSLARTLHWQSDWGPNPARFLEQLAHATSRPLPVIVTSDLSDVRAVELSGVRVRIRQLAVVRAFPFMAEGIPLAITSYRALAAFEARTKTYDSLGVLTVYALGKGPPAAVGRALASFDPAYPPQTIDSFLHDPEVVLATRTFRYMRLIAIASGVLALVGLTLYLQARQRSQAVASALAQRMGFGRIAQTVSLTIELACLLLFAGVIGAVVAIAAATPVVHRIDPLPVDPPSTILVIPTGELGLAAAGLLVVAAAAAAVTSWFAGRTDIGEALRIG